MEEVKNLHRDLYCVLFPGIVKNDEKAIECMGGLKSMSQCYTQSNKKRLAMTYQPENPFLRKMYADSKPTAGVLLKLKVKKTRTGNEIKREVISTSLVGSVNKINKFESMCDYQYLPVATPSAKSDKPQCFLENLLPSGVEQLNFMVEPSPMYITPPNFTRSDKPISYFYTEKRYYVKDSTNDDSMNVDDEVHKFRSERGLPIARYTFNLAEDLPQEPNEYYLKRKDARLAVYPALQQELEVVKKLFDVRPIWSLNLIKYHTKVKLISLKVIVPCLAIYMKEGPWRMMWVKYGYDPRKEPGARIYQTLDFRMRHAAGVHAMVMTRDQIVHCKKTDSIKNYKKCSSEPLSSEDIVYEGAVYFRPGMVPSQRQVYYQYCDVELPEVQQLLALEPPAGYLCHARRGWLPPDTDQLCRDHIFRSAKRTLLDTHKADLKFEDYSSVGSESDEEEATTSTSVNEADESLNILQ
ncbi:general transcription factor 3C polypeptide 5 [Bicyclus anynana]|uniref:General transcription factor 3C polypeptide 5 n=1 Tax=Bicyclus anynana TaxID=110368 RepID=A0ABM3M6U9_BICAN|nr:general transcription factor 3C polypeptide 5 [Bicyclus anynana]